MIGVPFNNNDLVCLSAASEQAADLVERRDPLLLQYAQRFPTKWDAWAHIRSLPQRDDYGAPGDGPKVEACDPIQRLRIPAPDPNCFERAVLGMIVAEFLDPWPVRQLATLEFDWGLHTILLENGWPIVLDPRVDEEEVARRLAAIAPSAPATGPASAEVRNAAPPGFGFYSAADYAAHLAEERNAAAPGFDVHSAADYAPYLAEERNAAPLVIDVREAIDYTAQLAEEGTRNVRNGPRLTWLARNAIRSLIDDGMPPRDEKTLDTLGWFFAQAEQIARSYGTRALTIVRTTAAAIADLVDDVLAHRQRNFSFDIGGNHFSVPSWLSDAAGTVGKIGLDVGAAYVRPYLLGAGITSEMLGLVEQELNAEGYSLGPLSKPGQSVTSALSSIASKSK